MDIKMRMKRLIIMILAVAMIVSPAALNLNLGVTASAEDDSYQLLTGKVTESWSDAEEGDLIQLKKHTAGQGIPIFIVPVHFGPDDVTNGGTGRLKTAAEWAKDTIMGSGSSFFDGFNDYFDVYVYVRSEKVYPVPASDYTDSWNEKYEAMWYLCQKQFPSIHPGNMRIIYLGNSNNVGLPSGTTAGQVGGWAYPNSGAYLSWGQDSSGNNWESNPSYWALHEFWGHGFAGFDDEYIGEMSSPDGPGMPNIYVSSSGKPSNMLVQWRDFIGFEEDGYTIDVYKHENSNRYLATENSFMNMNPCMYVPMYHKWVIYNRLMQYAGETKSLSDFCQFMNITLPNMVSGSGDGSSLCNIGDTIYADLTSGEVIRGNSVMGNLTKINDCSNISDLKWVLQTTKGKTSPAAKFYKKGKCNQSTIMGTGLVQIGALKANGQFNNTVVLKAVSKDGKTTFAEYTFFIAPAPVTKFKTPTKDIKTKTGITLSSSSDSDFSLEIPEGVSYKLPFSAKDGADKTLIYTTGYHSDDACFSVMNGTVKGLAKGSGTITVKPVRGDCSITVHVDVVGKISKIRANTTSLTMVPGLKQEFTVRPSVSSNLSETLSVSFNKNRDSYTVEYSTDNGEKWLPLNNNKVSADGAVMFQVALKEGKTAGGEKLTVTSDQKGAKATVTLKGATAPQNVKAFKETVKKAKNAKYRVINIPVGSYYNLGVSINPVTADSRFRFNIVDSGENDTTAQTVTINGDVVRGNIPGTVYVQAVSSGVNADNENVLSDIYQINVYSPASSFLFNDTGMIVKGKYLMEKTVADTTSDKELEGGREYTFAAPACGGENEPVTWTVNNPGAVALTEKGSNMSIKILAPGTYTVTGKSSYTKQSYRFKVMANKKENAGAAAEGVEYRITGEDDWDTAGSTAVDLSVGSTMQVRLNTSGICDKVKFSSSNSKTVSVSKTGLVKAGRASDTPVEITASVGTVSAKIKVQPVASSAGVKVTVPLYAGEKKSFKVSTSLKNAKWYYIDSQGAVNVLSVASGTVSNGLEQGVYKIFPSTAASANAVTENDKLNAKEINIYKLLATKVTVADSEEEIIKSDTAEDGNIYTKAADSDAATLKEMANKKIGVKGGKIFVLPINATGQNAGGEVVMAQKDSIIWQTSNANLATVKPLSEYGITDDSSEFYAQYAVEVNDKGYTGKVTLTGILKNGGKKAVISIYVTKATS